MAKPMPEIAKCNCGRAPVRNHASDLISVHCVDLRCWCGPIRTTLRGAINAWNRVMGGDDGE